MPYDLSMDVDKPNTWGLVSESEWEEIKDRLIKSVIQPPWGEGKPTVRCHTGLRKAPGGIIVDYIGKNRYIDAIEHTPYKPEKFGTEAWKNDTTRESTPGLHEDAYNYTGGGKRRRKTKRRKSSKRKNSKKRKSRRRR